MISVNNEEEMEQLKKAREQEMKIRSALKLMVDDAAFQRLSLMRVSNENLYSQVVSYLFSLFNAGKIKGRLNEEQLKQIASMFLSQRRESKIVRLLK